MLALRMQGGQPDPVLRVVVRPRVVPLRVEQAAVLPHRRDVLAGRVPLVIVQDLYDGQSHDARAPSAYSWTV